MWTYNPILGNLLMTVMKWYEVKITVKAKKYLRTSCKVLTSKYQLTHCLGSMTEHTSLKLP